MRLARTRQASGILLSGYDIYDLHGPNRYYRLGTRPSNANFPAIAAHTKQVEERISENGLVYSLRDGLTHQIPA